jgi:phosphohistidine phosphatase
MGTTLCLLRHGRATGQGPDAALMPEGEKYVAALGRRLAGEGFAPARAYTSPYRRARETARILLAEVAPGTAAGHLDELTPEYDPDHTIAGLRLLGLPAARVLLVGHLPLLGLLVQKLTHDIVAFSPGMLVELEMDEAWSEGRVTRTIGPDGVAG